MNIIKKKKKLKKFKFKSAEFFHQTNKEAVKPVKQDQDRFNADNIGSGLTYLLFSYLFYKYALADFISLCSHEISLTFSDIFLDISQVLDCINNNKLNNPTDIDNLLPVLSALEKFFKFLS